MNIEAKRASHTLVSPIPSVIKEKQRRREHLCLHQFQKSKEKRDDMFIRNKEVFISVMI